MTPSNLLTLPLDTLLLITEHISYRDVISLCQVCHVWNEIVTMNEGRVYRALCLYHHFAEQRHVYVEDAKSGFGNLPWLGGLRTWKGYFQHRLALEHNWLGRYTPSLRLYHDQYFHHPFIDGMNELDGIGIIPPIHRFKVDEVERTVICTLTGRQNGGLVVYALDRPYPHTKILFMLSHAYVRGYAHCEFSNGYLVFDRIGNEVEVWRRSNDVRLDGENQRSRSVRPPDVAQQLAYHEAYKPLLDDEDGEDDMTEEEKHRGIFLPYALLKQPSPSRAYRLIYPTLLVASEQAHEAYLWDITTSQLTQIIPIPLSGLSANPMDSKINYVELSERYIFVCLDSRLVVLARNRVDVDEGREEEGGGHLVLSLPPDDLTCHAYSRYRENVSYETLMPLSISESSNMILRPVHFHAWDGPGLSRVLARQRYNAVHVSPDGRDIIVLTEQDNLFYIPDFERCLSTRSEGSKVKLSDILVFVSNESFFPGSYLAFEHGRVAVISQNGVDLFSLKNDQDLFPDRPPVLVNRDGSNSNSDSFPFASAHTIQELFRTSCMALTRDSLWLTSNPAEWMLEETENISGRLVTEVSFAPTMDAV